MQICMMLNSVLFVMPVFSQLRDCYIWLSIAQLRVLSVFIARRYPFFGHVSEVYAWDGTINVRKG